MPRPSKRVSPDTLGGRMRAARQDLHLSLAEVAGERYSTSLISQIERNRVDPSQEGQGYFNLREFRQAQHNCLYAIAEKPVIVPSGQAVEAMMLALHLAAVSRELGQLDDAEKYYE